LAVLSSAPSATGERLRSEGGRQRIREFAGPDTPVHAADPGGRVESFTLEALLPASFGPETLSRG